MSDSDEKRNTLDPSYPPLPPDDEEAIRQLALVKHTFPSIDFDLTEDDLPRVFAFIDKHFHNGQQPADRGRAS